ncbi:MAG TPA: PQQ-dependent sugar dehydrogenase, partial [Panacibacter sp.]|nr:PQQ-dependent sugar dehydrogenase [Panacibacter sp.]
MITFVPKGFLQLFRLVILSVIAGLLSSANTLAQPVLKFQPRSASFAEVTDIQNAGDASQRLFIVQKSGAIKIYKNGEVLGTDFLNLTNIISYDGERGLLSIAFDPDYKNNRKFYVYYTN